MLYRKKSPAASQHIFHELDTSFFICKLFRSKFSFGVRSGPDNRYPLGDSCWLGGRSFVLNGQYLTAHCQHNWYMTRVDIFHCRILLRGESLLRSTALFSTSHAGSELTTQPYLLVVSATTTFTILFPVVHTLLCSDLVSLAFFHS